MVCPDCGMSTWKEDFGCVLPGCENYAVLEAIDDNNLRTWREEDDADGNDPATD